MFKPIALLCLTGLFTWAAPAAADPAPQPLVSPDQAPTRRGGNSSESRSSLPQAGDVELLLEAPPILNATNLTPGTVTRGLGVTSSSTFGIGTTFGLGLNAGVGYYLTDLVAVGGAVGVGGTLQGAHFNPFAEGGFIGGGQAGPDLGTAILGFDVDVGVDFLVSRGWGIAVFIPFSLVAGTQSGAPTVFGFGFGYGLVTYF